MADSKPSPAPVSSSGSVSKLSKKQAPKKTNKLRETARSAFDASAGSMSVEKFFTDFVEKKRDNVELTFDQGVLPRIAEPLVTRAKDHAMHRLNQDEESRNLQVATFALVSLTMARKMLLAVPSSEQFEVGRFKFLRDVEFFAPKSVISAVDNIGKFEHEDFVARLKYNSQDTFRLLMTMCKAMDLHDDYSGKYAPPVPGTWADLEVDRLVITSESSARWIRDQAEAILERAYEQNWEMFLERENPDDPDNPERVSFRVSYPRLKMSKDPEQQLRNVLAWLPLLDRNMPAAETVVCAGFATCWRLLYFQRVGHLMSNIERNVPAWFTLRPYDILTRLQMNHAEIGTDDYDGDGYIGFVQEIHRRIITMRPVFNQFLELAKQPDTAFGSVAQLVTYDKEKSFQGRDIVGLQDATYYAMKNDAQGECVVKVKNKGQVVAGLIFGFTSKVEVTTNYMARVNGNPNVLRANYLKSDFKNY